MVIFISFDPTCPKSQYLMNTPKVMKYEMHSADGTGSPDSNSSHHDVSANPNITANKRHVLFQSSQPTELLSAKDTDRS